MNYRSAAKYGQSRLAISWSRLIVPDGEEIAPDEDAVHPSAAAGSVGKVDNHWTLVLHMSGVDRSPTLDAETLA